MCHCLKVCGTQCHVPQYQNRRIQMPNFDNTYREKLKTAWDHFIRYEDYDFSFIRPFIFESWKRSRDYGIDPYDKITAILDSDTIQNRLEENSLLIEIAKPYMERLYSVVEGSGYYLLLSDKEGYILHLIGDEDIIAKGKGSLLVVGANRKESTAGTNAIGTCLELKAPIQIWDGEHYIERHKNYSCSSAPIFNHQGEVVGALNITGQFTEAHTHTLGMILSAVDGISKELKIRMAYSEIKTMSAEIKSVLEAVSSGLILLNNRDQITQINDNALKMLGFSYTQVMGKDINSIISLDEPHNPHSFCDLESETINKEVSLYFEDSSKPPIKCLISVNFVSIHGQDDGGKVISLQETKSVNKLVHRFSGFKASYTFESILGSSDATKKLIRSCEQAARSSSNTLILGESGTGKELVAQSIHNGSSFSNGPFVAINCAALPNGLIESELFGYEKGSFTGANKDGNPGKFELADGGTIFLDEIGDMPLDIQSSLLRVLQTKEILRIGGKYPKKINVRILAATNIDLANAVNEKTFREDLYYRLNVLSIYVPPLRERGNDVVELADYFVKTLNNPTNRELHIAPEVYPILRQHSWPGNIRELENAMERAVNVTNSDEIRPEHLPQFVQPQNQASEYPTKIYHEEPIAVELNSTPSQRGKALILESLKETNGNIKKAADIIGISRRTLYRKMDKYDIDYSKYRD